MMKYTNSLEKKVNDCYFEFYEVKILNTELFFEGKKIVTKKHPKIDEKCGTYFHIITKTAEDKRGNLIKLPCKKCGIEEKCEEYNGYNPLLTDSREKRLVCPERLENASSALA